MSDLRPENYPIIAEAEAVVHDAYEHQVQAVNNYEEHREDALIFAGLGSAALLAGSAISQIPAGRFNFLADTIGYIYAGTGLVSLVMAPICTAKAVLARHRLRRAS